MLKPVIVRRSEEMHGILKYLLLPGRVAPVVGLTASLPALRYREVQGVTGPGEREGDLLAAFALQFDLSRPHVRREFRLSEEVRAFAEHERDIAKERERETAERLREAQVERHRETTRAEKAEAAPEATRQDREADGLRGASGWVVGARA